MDLNELQLADIYVKTWTKNLYQTMMYQTMMSLATNNGVDVI